jgi:hypothetical protein
MPVRIIKKSAVSCTGRFWSVKNTRSISFESALEKDVFLSMEFDKTILSYEEQPFKVGHSMNNKVIYYYPDCFIKYKPELTKKDLIVEVKTMAELNDVKKQDKLNRKFTAIKSFAEANGFDFKVVTDDDIRGQLLDNRKFLYGFAEQPKTFDYFSRIILTVVAKAGTVSVNELLSNISQDRETSSRFLPTLWHMVFTGDIYVDLNKPLNNLSHLEVNHG